jgi:hypothetical protein
MLCETCRLTGRPGFVRVQRAASAHDADADERLIPCPGCGGSGIAHCCDGLCEQPDAPDDAAP